MKSLVSRPTLANLGLLEAGTLLTPLMSYCASIPHKKSVHDHKIHLYRNDRDNSSHVAINNRKIDVSLSVSYTTLVCFVYMLHLVFVSLI